MGSDAFEKEKRREVQSRAEKEKRREEKRRDGWCISHVTLILCDVTHTYLLLLLCGCHSSSLNDLSWRKQSAAHKGHGNVIRAELTGHNWCSSIRTPPHSRQWWCGVWMHIASQGLSPRLRSTSHGRGLAMGRLIEWKWEGVMLA